MNYFFGPRSAICRSARPGISFLPKLSLLVSTFLITGVFSAGAALALANQTIIFTSSPPMTPIVGSTYQMSANGGGSGNPVEFSVDTASSSNACTISSKTVSFTAQGTCIIDANEAGNTSYNAAAQASQTVTVGIGYAYTDEGAFDAVSIPRLGLGPSAQFYSVNDNGDAVGQEAPLDSSGTAQAIMWNQASGITDIASDTSAARIFPLGINDSGMVAGYVSIGTDDTYQAFVWTASTGLVDLGTLGGVSSRASAINNTGEIVGTSQVSSGDWHAFYWTPSSGMVDIGTLDGYSSSEALGLNNDGEIVGDSSSPSGITRAFAWTSAGGIINLGAISPSSAQSVADSVNDSGQIIGSSLTSTTNAFGNPDGDLVYWASSSSPLTDLGLPGDPYSNGFVTPYRINNNGEVVGQILLDTCSDPFSCHDNANGAIPFYWSAATGGLELPSLPNSPAFAENSAAADINNEGEIVGEGMFSETVSGNATIESVHAVVWNKTAPPAAPANLTAVSPVQNPSLAWGSVPGASSYNIYRDNALIGSSSTGSYTDNSAPEGTDSYYVTAVNPAGESSPSNAVAVLVDRTPPVVSGPSLTADPKSVSQSADILNAQVSDPLVNNSASGLASAQYYDPIQQVWLPMTLNGATATAAITFSATAYPSGIYPFEVRAADNAGNLSSPVTVYLDVYDPSGGHAAGHGTITPNSGTSNPGDTLPTESGGNPRADFNFTVKYAAPTDTTPSGSSIFTWGSNCNSPHSDCFSMTTDLSGAVVPSWLIVDATTYTATFQGSASLTQGTTSLGTGYPVRITTTSGAVTGATSHYLLQIYPIGSNPDVATPLYQASGDLIGGQIIVHG